MNKFFLSIVRPSVASQYNKETQFPQEIDKVQHKLCSSGFLQIYKNVTKHAG